MTKEQIEEASKKFAEENVWNPGTSCESDIITLKESVIAAFKDGADWRINSVWHKPEEVPEANRWIIHLDRFEYDVYKLLPAVIPHWGFLAADKGIVRWAYIDDLIPTEEDERNS